MIFDSYCSAFATESYAQLLMMFDEYYNLTGRCIENSILFNSDEMSKRVKRAFMAVGILYINIFIKNKLKNESKNI